MPDPTREPSASGGSAVPRTMNAAAHWPGPTPEMLADPQFDAVWNVIKTRDITVPAVYSGYCGATGNHVRAILDGWNAALAHSKGGEEPTAPTP